MSSNNTNRPLRTIGLTMAVIGVAYYLLISMIGGQWAKPDALTPGKALAARWDNVQFGSMGMAGLGTYSRDMPVCGLFTRDFCVVDANSIRLEGTRITMKNYQAPRLNGVCEAERQLAKEARQRLSELLSSQPFSTNPGDFGIDGQPAYAFLSIGAHDLGTILVSEGLAIKKGYSNNTWCAETAGSGLKQAGAQDKEARKERIAVAVTALTMADRCDFELDRTALVAWTNLGGELTRDEQLYSEELFKRASQSEKTTSTFKCMAWRYRASSRGWLPQ
ncbi:hypothetical protein [Hoeflea prorocentri]|uniref:Nuclease n=1 Tax=Hoeflea prorocentri TaxID=1922333 RepID=A0A9X3UFR2_9HYPH|nr:hypothetical protein [Hoeflea prorocentri]MCY6380508.1 hypothetical protein [Hoeflea prorocentri]MDA5398308.1 hypothetical protein [Hoeflea prorocentri]